MINLGDKVKDDVSGMIGIAVRRIEHLNGCIQFGVEPLKDKKSNQITSYDIDDVNLTKVDNGLNKRNKLAKRKPKNKPGGPRVTVIH